MINIYIYNFLVAGILLIMCTIKMLPKKSYIYLITIYFMVVFGQRWFGGVDFAGYFRSYLGNFRFEVGFYKIQNFFLAHDINFGIFIFMIYSFTTIVSLCFFRKFSYSNLGIFLFFLSEYHTMSLNPLRTYIAVNIFLIGIYFINIKNKNILGFIIMFMGLFFHTLTFGAILVYIILKWINIFKLKKKLDLFLFIIPLINLRPFLYIVTSIALPRYLSYFGGIYDQPLSMMNRFRYYIILFLFMYFKNNFNIEDTKERLILKGTYIFLVIMGMATYFAELHRIAYFYKIFELLFFIYLLDWKILGKYSKKIIIIVLLVNYLGIIYKDMGCLFYYKLKPLEIHATKTNSEYFEEINKYYKAVEEREKK